MRKLMIYQINEKIFAYAKINFLVDKVINFINN